MVEDLIKRLRSDQGAGESHWKDCEEAADLIEQQAARLTALESERDALLNSLAAARQAASTAWVRHAMATRIGNAAAAELAKLRNAEPVASCLNCGMAVDPKCGCSLGRLAWQHATINATPDKAEQDIQASQHAAPTAAPEKGDGRDAWISVDERLPEERQVVLVFRPDAHLLPACDPNIDCRCYFGNGVFNGIHPVTHWMPLPAPPAALYQKANDGLSLRAQHEDACIAANNNAQDAERYRWLRTLDSDFGNRNRMSEMARFYGETLDEAIDAALSQKAGEQQ